VKGYRYENPTPTSHLISVPETPLRAGTRNKHNNNTNNGEVNQDINAATIPRKIPYPLALIVAMIINCMPIKYSANPSTTITFEI
jgi:hypothetical protein